MELHNGRPGDVRNFVHKRIIGAVTGGIGGLLGGGPLGGIGGAFRGFLGGGKKPAPVTTQPFPITTVFPGSGGFAPGGCPGGFFRNAQGQCVPLGTRQVPGFRGELERFLPGGATGFQEFGAAVMGRFGAALEPGFRESSTAVCPRGTVLGMDDLCYNRKDIKNSERKWPRGRKPLLTGGEMRCISIAAGAAKRLERKTKQLQSLGMLKKPSASKRRALPSGHHAHLAHDARSDH